jgi:hypothetical protein
MEAKRKMDKTVYSFFISSLLENLYKRLDGFCLAGGGVNCGLLPPVKRKLHGKTGKSQYDS